MSGHHGKSPWSPVLDDELLRLTRLKISFTEIADRLNATFGTDLKKNACVGRFHRRWGNREDVSPKPPKDQEAKPKRLELAQKPVLPPLPEPTGPVPLLARTSRQCCWPVTDASPWLYCGAPKRRQRGLGDTKWMDYCDEHYERLIQKHHVRRKAA